MGVDLGWVSEQEHTEPNPEVALARAVILTAIQDASGRPGANGTSADQRQARAFLFARSGEWAAARRAWCEVADISEEWLRRRVRAFF